MNDFTLSFHTLKLEKALRCREADYVMLYMFDQGSGWNTVSLTVANSNDFNLVRCNFERVNE